MSIYPPKVWQLCERPRNAGKIQDENAAGTDANFVCGSFLAFSLRIDPAAKSVADVAFQTNGCGYMIAAADCLADSIRNRPLIELHGLNEAELYQTIGQAVDAIDENRQKCVDCCIRALRSAFADYRTRQIEEFRGEKALICTCFGVSEETIVSCIAEGSLRSVDEITQATNAGGGCGSCRMLIQEMIDERGIAL